MPNRVRGRVRGRTFATPDLRPPNTDHSYETSKSFLGVGITIGIGIENCYDLDEDFDPDPEPDSDSDPDFFAVTLGFLLFLIDSAGAPPSA